MIRTACSIPWPSTVASDGKRIFAAFPNYELVAYDLDGAKLWEYPHEIVSQFYYGGASSPMIADSIVIYLVSSGTDPRIVGLDCQTGDSIWTIRNAGPPGVSFNSCATPVIHDSLLILHTFQGLVAYQVPKGNAVWWLFTPITAVATPLITDHMLYLNTWTQGGEERARGEILPYAKLLEVCDKNGNGSIEQEEFREDMKIYERPETPDAPYGAIHLKDDIFFSFFDANKDRSIDENEYNSLLELIPNFFREHGMLALSLEGKGERPVTDILWKVNRDTPETPSPLSTGNKLFFIKDGGIVTIIDRESGEVVFNDRIGAPGAYLASPIFAGNRIYVCSFNGTVTVISAVDFSVLGTSRLRERIGASPVAVDDVLYIRTDKNLYAFREL